MQAVLYIHGRNGNAAEAEHYKTIFKNCSVFGLDYHGSTPFDTKDEISAAYDKLIHEYENVTLIANSIGAFFAMNALQNQSILRAFFISPIVNMERLILDIMKAENVTEPELKQKQEINTAFGEKLSWQYLDYVRTHPITWKTPTYILYGERDNLTSQETIKDFAERINSKLTILTDGEHYFHTEEQLTFLDNWLKQNI